MQNVFSAYLSRWIIKSKIQVLKSGIRFFSYEPFLNYLLETVDYGVVKAGRPTVLCLSRPLFEKDISQLRERVPFNWICIKNEYLGHYQKGWMRDEMCFQTRFQSFRTPEDMKLWKRSRDFSGKVFEKIQERAGVRIDAVLSSHIDYWQGEGMRMYVQDKGVPFLGLCREHNYLPMEQRTVREYYTGYSFEGNAVAVAGEQTKKVFLSSGACLPDQVVVTGLPRFDIWKSVDTTQEKDLVLLLSFFDKDYRAQKSFEDCLRVFLNMARSDTSQRIYLIKAKNKKDYNDLLVHCRFLPSNVQITYTEALFDLFPRSELVIGFNTLALVEALFVGAEIIVPNWGDAVKPYEELMFDPMDSVSQKAVRFPDSPENMLLDLKMILEKKQLEVRTDHRARNEFIKKLVHYEETQLSSQRVEQFILEQIAKSQNIKFKGAEHV